MNNKNEIPLPLFNYNQALKKRRKGFSMYFFQVFENLAMVAPSIILWSAVQLTHTT
jgi:hypothetical protein